MKARDILFWLILFLVVIDLFFTLHSKIQTGGNQGIQLAIWLCKIGLHVGCLLMGCFFYRIKTSYTEIGYLDNRSATALKVIASITFCLAFIYAMQQALQQLWESEVVFGHQINTTSYLFFVNDFMAFFLTKTPFLLLLTLSLFLLTDFVKRAIVVKNENDSFI